MEIKNAFADAAQMVADHVAETEEAIASNMPIGGYVIPQQQGTERIGYPSFEAYDREKQADEQGLYSAQSLQGMLSDKNSMCINGIFYKVPDGFDVSSMFGEQLYPDLETCLNANMDYRADMNDWGEYQRNQTYREPGGMELVCDLMMNHNAMMMPDGSVYRIPDDFEVPSDWTHTGDIQGWSMTESVRADSIKQDGRDAPKQEWNKSSRLVDLLPYRRDGKRHVKDFMPIGQPSASPGASARELPEIGNGSSGMNSLELF